MPNKHIIFVPGKNPKPPAPQHRDLLWRTLVEGAKRADTEQIDKLSCHPEAFHLIAWNYLYYGSVEKDISRDLPWIDALINTHAASKDDITEAKSWHRKWDRLLFTLIDHLHFLLPLAPKPIRMTAQETFRYFNNRNNVACEIRELLKQELRPLLQNGTSILLIGHSLGSVIAYDTLWELHHEECLPGKVDLFLTIGSPLGMHYVQKHLMGFTKKRSFRTYPENIRHWVNISSVGDVTALDTIFRDDFNDMLERGLIESITDHCRGIYNFYRDDQGLNCHRSYGYLVNPAVGKVIIDWWLGKPTFSVPDEKTRC